MSDDKKYKHIVETYSYDVKTNTFNCVETYKYKVGKKINIIEKKEMDDKQKMETAIEHIGELINKHTHDNNQHLSKNHVFDVPIGNDSILENAEELITTDDEMCMNEFDICEDIESISSECNEKECDESELIQNCKKRMEQLQELKRKKKEELEQIDEKYKEEQKEVADVCSVISLEKRNKKLDEENEKQNRNKFECDRKTYKLIKKDMECDKLDLDNLPSFFIKQYEIFTTMDNDGTIDNENAYDIFIKKYKECDIGNEENIVDKYGIFN
jgi:hypothetical protein